MKLKLSIFLLFHAIVLFSAESIFNNNNDLIEEFTHKIILQEIPPSSRTVDIPKSFGENFDFEKILRPNDDPNNKIYIRRLKSFRSYLFDYVYDIEVEHKNKVEQSGIALKFLKCCIYTAAISKSKFDSRFLFGEKIIDTFFPLRDLKDRPIIRIKQGFIVFNESEPIFLLTEPDAESICVNLRDQKTNNPLELITIILRLLKETPEISKQATDLLNHFLINNYQNINRDICYQYIYRIKPDIHSFDKKALQNCKQNCPFLKKLALLENRIVLQKNTCSSLLRATKNGTYEFQKEVLKLMTEVNDHISVFKVLSAEYLIIYKRIQKTLQQFKKKKRRVIDKEELTPLIEPTLIQPVPQPIEQKITYAPRVLRWFYEDFTLTMPKESIIYHSLLPLFADPLLVQFGYKSFYDNRTRPGQKDNHYTITGKIKDEETNNESFALFDLCIDQLGVCYHRGFQTYSWQELNPLHKNTIIDEANTSENISQYKVFKEVESKSSLLKETPFFATFYNPQFKRTITLYKNQFI
jgi:hypothetical protein